MQSNAAQKAKGLTLREYWKQYKIFEELGRYEVLEFEPIYDYYFRYLFTLICEVVQLEGIPETMSETFFKYCVFVQGKCTVFREDSGELRGLNGTYSDLPDIYYMPDYMLVTNPRLLKTYRLKRGEECAVVYCREIDKYSAGELGGLYMLIHKTAVLLADNCISINAAQKNTRLMNLIGADDQTTKNSIDEVMAAMYSGKPFKAVQASLIAGLTSVPLQPSAQNRYLVDLIQIEQYILSHFYEAIGLSTHDQMKRERLVTAEINDNIDLSLFNIYNIIKTISAGLDEVNQLFGTEIRCSLNPLILDQLAAEGDPEAVDPEAAADETPENASDLLPDDEKEAEDNEEAEEPAEASDPEEVQKKELPDFIQALIDKIESVASRMDFEEPELEAAEEDPEPEPEEPEAAAIDIDINIDQDPEPETEAAEEDPEPEPEESEAAAIDIEINIDQDPEPEPEAAEEDPEPEAEEPEEEGDSMG